MQNIKLSGFLFIVFLALSFGMAVFYMPKGWENVENPTRESIMVGTWTPDFEKSLNESLPVFEPSRNLWGKIQYLLFGQGRKGVVVGENGWLFTDEEFSCLPSSLQHMAENLDYVAQVKNMIEGRGAKLHVVLVPAKARVYEEHLGRNKITQCRKDVYSDVLSFMKSNEITVTGLLDGIKSHKNKDTLFLKSDTHWTPEGAGFAAELVAKDFNLSGEIVKKSYVTEHTQNIEHEGDLLRYLPGVSDEVIRPDHLSVYKTEEVHAEDGAEVSESLDLFGDDVPPVTLVGTSYSANSKWHFAEFLKGRLQVDVFNAADEGLGPFAVMKTYLGGNAWKNSMPSIVIWEIPERYVVVDQSQKEK
ncbi:MAG: hypothetical protein OEY94_03650 [Alphaproteobacteria bacterium]|nr:hypothetical protein [Alphaproteobacteria bacterium]